MATTRRSVRSVSKMPASKPRFSVRKSARDAGYRSGLEHDNAKFLRSHGVKFEYESLKISYLTSPKVYRPDFVLKNGIIVETKGRFLSRDRVKHLLVQEQHPELDVRFVFSNANSKLNKTSNTTYALWCDQHGFKWAEGLIPLDWTKE